MRPKRQVHRMVWASLFLWAGLFSSSRPRCFSADEIELRVLPVRDPKDRTPSALYQRLQHLADQAIDRRSAAYETIKSTADVENWQRERRATFLKALGEFPQRTPLNAQIVGRLPGDGFRVERVIFESQPYHHVTANLYLPTSDPPYPAAIVPCGHSHNGKASEAYQRVCMLLAKNGIAAFCYDPLGQGERYQSFDTDGKPLGGDAPLNPASAAQLREIPGTPRFNCVEEHTLIGMGAILVGTNTAMYRIHDGMRAIDYLVSRHDIDPKRIGCTGNSGGGTLSAYLMAIDDRIACAASVCYLTTFRRLIATAGPQDAEQNLFGQLRDGLDEPDFAIMRAPKPTALCAGTRDGTFDIKGTWDNFREAKRVFGRLGYSERVDLVEADEPHGFTLPLRVGVTRWMRRWLLQVDEPIVEPDLRPFTAAELQCVPNGQVMFMSGERSVYEINLDRAKQLATKRPPFSADQIRHVAGIRPGAKIEAPKMTKLASIDRAGYRIDKLLLETDEQLTLPTLAFVPGKANGRRVLYLHDDGKLGQAQPGGELERLVLDGALVFAVDLSGVGESLVRHPRDWGRSLFSSNTQEFFVAYLLGRSLVGLRAEEIIGSAKALAMYEPTVGSAELRVDVISNGAHTGVAALHAIALEPDRFRKFICRKSLASWGAILESKIDGVHLADVIHGALAVYDLGDLRSHVGDGTYPDN